MSLLCCAQASELEDALRNGVYLVRLAMFFDPDSISLRHVFDLDEKIYKERGLHFRHTDNITQWLKAMKAKSFPEIFYPEVPDVYVLTCMCMRVCMYAIFVSYVCKNICTAF